MGEGWFPKGQITMSKLLPDRHPNRDFFIVDIKDANPKDDMASMEHPVFSLSVKPDTRKLKYEAANGRRLVVIPSGKGLATIMDKDVILYAISKLVADRSAGRPITRFVEMTAHEILTACNWRTNDAGYKRLEDALDRLRGTTIKTDVETGKKKETEGFGLINYYKMTRIKNGAEDPFGRLSKVVIELSAWTFRAVEANEILTISRQYFRLRRPLERRLYEIARKHVGNKTEPWLIGLEKLQEKVGSTGDLKKFRFNLRQIIDDGNIPDYGLSLDGDNVMMQRLVKAAAVLSAASYIKLRPDTIDKAQVIAASIGVSVFDLEREWNEWAAGKQEELQSPDGAFIAFCKQKSGSIPARRVVDARSKASEAQQLGFVLPQGLQRRA